MSCFSSCFMGSLVREYESEPAVSSVGSKSKSVWFSWWRRGKRKKKTVPIDTTPTGEEAKFHKQRKRKPQQQQLLQQQQQQRQVVPATQSQTPTLPTISPKYSTRNRPVTAMIVARPVETRIATVHSAAALPGPKAAMPPAAAVAARDEHLEPVVGLSVLVITLSALLMYGRVCAVFCLCACFYLVPLFLTTGGEAEERKREKSVKTVDMNSEQYKKKVILEGLLERNRPRLIS